MKLKVGGGRLNTDTGKIEKLPEHSIEVADTWMDDVLRQMYADTGPQTMVVSADHMKLLRERN